VGLLKGRGKRGEDCEMEEGGTKGSRLSWRGSSGTKAELPLNPPVVKENEWREDPSKKARRRKGGSALSSGAHSQRGVRSRRFGSNFR